MNMYAIVVLTVMVFVFNTNARAQEKPSVLYPKIFWENNMDKGAILASPTEILLMDSKGVGYRKLLVNYGVEDIYMSPDGKKLIYTAASKIWLVQIENAETRLVVNGDCGYLRWNADGLSFMFTINEYEKDNVSIGAIKFFWADGDGKNIKQIYP